MANMSCSLLMLHLTILARSRFHHDHLTFVDENIETVLSQHSAIHDILIL